VGSKCLGSQSGAKFSLAESILSRIIRALFKGHTCLGSMQPSRSSKKSAAGLDDARDRIPYCERMEEHAEDQEELLQQRAPIAGSGRMACVGPQRTAILLIIL